MKEKKYIRIWMCAVSVFAVSAAAASWVYSGVSLSELARPAGSVSSRPVIVIDPGHGGMDGGAVAAAGSEEKDLTLAISLALAKEAEAYGAEVIMTRTGDQGLYDDDGRTVREKKREDLIRRKEIIEGAGAELAISVHLNSFPQDVSVYGAQVFYPAEHRGRTDVPDGERTSRAYAEKVQEALEINIDDGRTREVMTKDDILMFKNINTNIILVECGFLSNEKEARQLETAEYQQLLAESIWQGVNEILCLEKKQELEIIYSTNTTS